MSSWARRFLRTITEPRSVTALMIAAYAVCALTGAGLILRAPVLAGWQHEAMRYTAALVLLPAGVAGVPAAWSGIWWLERGVALAAAFGWATALIEAVVVEASTQYSLSMPVVTIAGCLLAMVQMLMRWRRCTGAPYAPGHGPVKSPETIAAAMAAASDH